MLIKKAAPLAILAAAGLVLAGCASSDGGNTGGGAKAPTELTVGVLTSLSGPSAFSGQAFQEGREIAIAELTGNGGLLEGIDINIELIDDASDPNQGITGMQRLGSNEKVVTVIGGVLSSVVAAVAPVAQRGATPFIIVNSFAPTLTEAGDYVYQISSPTAEFNTKEAIEVAKSEGIKTVSIVYAQDLPTTVGFRDDFLAGFKEAGIKVVADEPGSVNDADYTTMLRNAMAPKPDAIVRLFLGPQDGLIDKQLGELGYGDVIRMGHVGDVAQGYIDNSGQYGPGLITNTGFFQDSKVDTVVAYMKTQLAEYGHAPTSTPNPHGYQAFMAWGQAVHNLIDDGQEVTRENIKTALLDIGQIPSILGSAGTAEWGGSTGRILTYDGYILTLSADKKWVEWTP